MHIFPFLKICCPKDGVDPPKTRPLPICEGDQIDEWYDIHDIQDYDDFNERLVALGCEVFFGSEDEAMKYNPPDICTEGTSCQHGSKCGSKGKGYSHGKKTSKYLSTVEKGAL